jgi:cellulose synthase/poly-beta-1,6-N-acetylglucosamine synthase-like glycosyltransferase
MTTTVPSLRLRASVVISAYQAAADLPRCLAALQHQTLGGDEFEIIVVDDGSSDETAAVAEAAGVRVLRLKHSGPAAARNAGAAIAFAPIIVFTDADCEPVPEFLERLLESFAAPVVSGARGVYRSQQKGLVARFVQLEYEERYQRIAHYEQAHHTINALDTSYCAYRREIFLAAGGFDTRFLGAAGEDHELSYRLAEAGHVFRFNQEAAVYHRHVDSFSAYARRKFRIGFWKSFLTRQHPGYAVADAHTTQSLKLQIALTAAMWLALVAWPLWRPLGWVCLFVTLSFLATTIPFLIGVLRRDPAVLVVALPLLFIRAAASGLGFAWGLFKARPQPRTRDMKLGAESS